MITVAVPLKLYDFGFCKSGLYGFDLVNDRFNLCHEDVQQVRVKPVFKYKFVWFPVALVKSNDSLPCVTIKYYIAPHFDFTAHGLPLPFSLHRHDISAAGKRFIERFKHIINKVIKRGVVSDHLLKRCVKGKDQGSLTRDGVNVNNLGEHFSVLLNKVIFKNHIFTIKRLDHCVLSLFSRDTERLESPPSALVSAFNRNGYGDFCNDNRNVFHNFCVSAEKSRNFQSTELFAGGV